MQVIYSFNECKVLYTKILSLNEKVSDPIAEKLNFNGFFCAKLPVVQLGFSFCF